LVPNGHVPAGCLGGKNKVHISISASCKSNLRAWSYNVHERFRHLRADSIPARLHLAMLYAATSTLVPEPRMQATGEQPP
jgi:hypothetical protein